MPNSKGARESVGRHVHTNVRLPVDVFDELKRLAEDQERTVSAEIRRLVRLHIEREKETA
jgi:predicted DNA-binding protein